MSEPQIEVLDRGSTILLPFGLLDTRLDLVVRPIEILAVRLTISNSVFRPGNKKVALVIPVSNLAPKDYRVSVTAVLLDGEGTEVATARKRKTLDDGQYAKFLELSWSLPADVVAGIETVRLKLFSERD